MGRSSYGRSLCEYCRRTISVGGFARYQHLMAHVRQGFLTHDPTRKPRFQRTSAGNDIARALSHERKIEHERERADLPPLWFEELLLSVAESEGRTDLPKIVYHRSEYVTGHFHFWPEPELTFAGPSVPTDHAYQLALHEMAHWITGPRAEVTSTPDGTPIDVEIIWHGLEFYETAWRLYHRHWANVALAVEFEVGYQGQIAIDGARRAGYDLDPLLKNRPRKESV